MDAIEALRTRRCVRAYKQDPVPREVVEAIVDCGRLAATARNVQPWEFVVVTDAGLRTKIAQIATYGKFIADAPVCIVVLCQDGTYFLEDGSAATQNIMVAARAFGLGSCWVAGDKKPYADEVRSLVGAPDTCRLVSLIAVGHPAGIPRPEKRELSSVLHWESF